MTAPFLALRALGWKSAIVVAPVVIEPPVDPLRAAVLRRLVAGGCWRTGATLELLQSGGMVRARIFLAEFNQADRSSGREEAASMRDFLKLALQLEGVRRVFADHLWCEQGKKGWAVVARGSLDGPQSAHDA